MSLFDSLPIDSMPTAQAASQAGPAERPYTVTIKRASNGADILLCSVTPPPAAVQAEAKQRNLALFTLNEIPIMRQAGADDPRYIGALVETRRVMGWGGPITFKVAP